MSELTNLIDSVRLKSEIARLRDKAFEAKKLVWRVQGCIDAHKRGDIRSLTYANSELERLAEMLEEIEARPEEPKQVPAQKVEPTAA